MLRDTLPARPIILDLITPIKFGVTYKLRGSSLCNFLKFPASFSLLRQIFSSELCFQTPIARETKFHTRKNKR